MTKSAPAVPSSVVVVTIDYRHGTSTSAYRSDAGAERALHEHASTWWDELAPDPGPMPTEPAAAIEEYFRRHPSDFYTTETVEVLD